jgi:hypothetical protein
MYLVLIDPYPVPGGPKTYGSYGSRSATLLGGAGTVNMPALI